MGVRIAGLGGEGKENGAYPYMEAKFSWIIAMWINSEIIVKLKYFKDFNSLALSFKGK